MREITRVKLPHKSLCNGRKLKKQLCPALHLMDYTPDELEFMRAVDAYKQERNRPFPTVCELLKVLLSLGYRKGPAHGDRDAID